VLRVCYRTGFVEHLEAVGRLPATTIEASDLPSDLRALVVRHLLDLGGTYGDAQAGDPIQYDELRIEYDQGEVEIVVYNRAILLFTTDNEAVRRIHRCAAGSKTWRQVASPPGASSPTGVGPVTFQVRRTFSG
jgi:hypothetical protein